MKKSRQPQFQILTDHFEFHQAQCSDLIQFKTKHFRSLQTFAVTLKLLILYENNLTSFNSQSSKKHFGYLGFSIKKNI